MLSSTSAEGAASVDASWSAWFFEQMSQGKIDAIRNRAKNFALLFTILTVGLMALSPEIVRFLGDSRYDAARYVAVPLILDAFDNDLKHVRQPMKKGRKVSDSAAAVRAMHGMLADSLEQYMNSITVQDLLKVLDDDEPVEAVMADAFETEAARLRAKVK